MIRIVSFDLDGTLVDKNFDELLWFEEIPKEYAKKHGVSINKAKQVVFSEYDNIKEKGHYKWTDIAYWFEKFNLDEWQTVLDRIKGKIKLYDDVIPVLEELKGKYSLIIITQSEPKMIKQKISTESIKKYFSMIISVPGDFKRLKKDKDVFENIIKKLGISKKEIVHVGDSYELDYKCAAAAGIKAFFLDRERKANGNSIVYSLTEFLEKIKEIEKE